MSRTVNVYANRPNALDGVPAIALPGHELWLTYVKKVIILDGVLDALRLERALGDALQAYPHAAGRLRRVGQDWFLDTSRAEVILELEHAQDTACCQLSDAVVQEDLSKLLRKTPSRVDPDQPLLHVKITWTRSETAVGISWHHVLGDATAFLRFMRIFSDRYENPTSPSVHPTPSFAKYFFTSPSEADMARFLPVMPHLSATYPLSALGAIYGQHNKNTSRIDSRLSPDDIARLRACAEEQPADLGSEVGRLSAQDVITAWIVTVLDRCSPEPIESLTNAASYRGVEAPFIDSATAGNAIYIISTCLTPNATHELRSHAECIRKSINDARQPHYIQQWMSVASKRMLDAANAGESMFFANPSGTLSVNSQASIDLRVCHFGFAASGRVYTIGTAKRYLRVFRANPLRGPDGRWQPVESGTLHISFGVSDTIRGRVYEIMRDDLSMLRRDANAKAAAQSTEPGTPGETELS